VLNLVHLRRALAVAVAVAALGLAQENRVAVVAPQGAFSVPVVERDGKEYVRLLELLRPLGDATAKADGKKWKLRFAGAEGEFKAGDAKAKVRGKTVGLTVPFVLDGEQGLVPLHGLAPVLARLMSSPFEFREAGRRLIVGPPTTFSAELNSLNQLVLHFSAPVNPSVATEPGRLRLDFTRDPVASANATQSFSSHLITSASFAESNGAAELTISGTAPLMAGFSDNGRTITIGAAPKPQVAARLPQAPGVAPPTPPAGPETPKPGQPQPSRPRFLVVIDPAHGGEDRGALLADNVQEKDLALAWARRLRAALEKAGISALLLRDADMTLTADQRAVAANAARPSVFLSVHVDDAGGGVRVYTARMADSGASPGAVLPWDTAQAAYLGASRALAGNLVTELTKREVPHGAARAQLRPLNSIAGAAVAIEVGPSGADLNSLNSPQYQQAVCGAVADAIAAARAASAAANAPANGPVSGNSRSGRPNEGQP
jgi:N-acetylmuramoyl-L-alanine amidase